MMERDADVERVELRRGHPPRGTASFVEECDTEVPTPDRLTNDDIAALLDGLGGMDVVLAEAPPAEKADLYASLGLRLTYRPDQRAVLATADLGRVVSRVGGTMTTLTPHSLGRGTYDVTAG